MSVAIEQSTVSLWSFWQAHRDELVPFGSCCALARSGALPGAEAVRSGTHCIRVERIADAVPLMRKGAS